MHCSSFEPFLDEYVDGDLPPMRAAKIAEHVETCSGCAAMLTELRVIDGLLLAPRQIELAPNFTFKVMAETRAMPVPRAHRSHQLSHHVAVLGTYVVFAWVAIAGFLVFGGSAARSTLDMLGVWMLHGEHVFERLSLSTSHLFGHQSFDVTALMGTVIAVDLVGAAAVFALYARLRNRRALQGTPD